LEIFNPPNELKADFIYAVLSVDVNNSFEGICSLLIDGQHFPCVALKEKNIELMFELTVKQHKESGILDKKIVRAKFKRVQ
jgi:hypothetical protein